MFRCKLVPSEQRARKLILDLAIKFFLEQRFWEFHDVKAHCIGDPNKIILLFCIQKLFFRNKARTADSSDNEFIVKVCV